ncbi:ribosome-associated translation inhibitor RaiA [Patescibacteria group bacterium]|nr:ribosome-associated translation inhibitor RaiA [Patescibacteria group bacterium]
MVEIDIHGVHITLEPALKRYIIKKINHLEKYVPLSARRSLHVDIYLSENRTHGGKQCECEAVVHLPKETIRIHEATMNMYAATDIVEEKLKQALIRYKELHGHLNLKRHLQNRSHL